MGEGALGRAFVQNKFGRIADNLLIKRVDNAGFGLVGDGNGGSFTDGGLFHGLFVFGFFAKGVGDDVESVVELPKVFRALEIGDLFVSE